MKIQCNCLVTTKWGRNGREICRRVGSRRGRGKDMRERGRREIDGWENVRRKREKWREGEECKEKEGKEKEGKGGKCGRGLFILEG